MESSDLILEIQRILPPGTASEVYKALKRDSIIWSGLKDEQFFQRVLSFAGDRMDSWRPGSLAMLAFGDDVMAEELAKPEMPGLRKNLRQQAVQLYEDVLRAPRLPDNVEEAGLLALALRERRRLTKSWLGLVGEICGGRNTLDEETVLFWQTPLVCLYGLVPDPAEMLKNLLDGEAGRLEISLVTAIILANPMPLMQRKSLFTHLMRNLTVEQQVLWMRLLQSLGESDVAVELAEIAAGSEAWESKVVEEPYNPQDALKKAVALEESARLHRLARKNQQAYELIESARDMTQVWLAGLEVQLAELALKDGDVERALPIIEKMNGKLPEAIRSRFETAIALGKHPQAKNIIERMPECQVHPVVEIERARLIYEKYGEREKAQTVAREAAEKLAVEIEQDASWLASEQFSAWSPISLLKALLDMDLAEAALSIARLLIRNRPADIDLIDLLSAIYEEKGDLPKAIEYTRVAQVLQPQETQYYRRSAALWETQGKWGQAYNDRLKVLNLDESPDTTDKLAFAKSASYSGQIEKAVEMCESVLEEEPNNGAANVLMGLALAEHGDAEEAIPYLSKASMLMPEEPQPWLLLSKAYANKGQQKRSLETLRAGVLAVPDSPELNFSLAEAYLAEESLSEALPFLKKAAVLKPESLDVAVRLGEVLVNLGHLLDARQVLTGARESWPEDPNLAFLFGKLLIAFGENDDALRTLEVALKKDPPEYSWFILFAETLIGDWIELISDNVQPDFARLVNAQQALEKALTINADDFKANLMLAEVLSAKGRPDAAIEIYRGLVEADAAEETQWMARVQSGLGKAALEVREIETALAALQEAANAQPDNVAFHQLLAQAYLEADLVKDALQIARYAQRLAPDNLDVLSWFADLAEKIGQDDDALDALQCATQLSPSVPDYWIRLANIQVRTGEQDTARTSLAKLVDLGKVTSENLRQAAYAYLRLDDRENALASLERSVEMSMSPEADLLFELAKMRKQVGDIDGALESVQKAVAQNGDEIAYYVFQADQLDELDRTQAAIACLDKALKLRLSAVYVAADGTEALRWTEDPESVAGIQVRLARLHRKLGDPATALSYAEQALNGKPNDLLLRVLVISLAKSLLKTEKVEETIFELPMEKLAVDMDHREQWPLEYDEALTQFLCTKAETELAQDKVEEAESLLNDVLSFASRHPRVIAGQARVAVRKGKWQAAREQFKRALILSSDLGVKLAVSGVKQQAAVQGLIEEVCRERPLWLAEAGLEVQAWAEVALLGEEAVADTPEEPGAYFEMARKLVLVAERQLICQELGCLNNSPGEQVLDSEAFDRFDQAIAKAGQLSQSDEVNFWNVRGKAIFKPTAPNVRALMSAVEAGAHPASLMAVLRRIKNPTSALQYAREYPQDISVLVEIVLCQMELDALEAHQAAKRLVEATPGDPLYWSALSLAADKDNDPQGALEAIETALANWPDEPDWHARAAAYAVQAETYNKDVEHLSEAVALAPEKVEYGMALAKSFMTQNNPVQAINVLNRPEYISEDHPEVWLALAKAHQNAGQLEQALFSSEQAAVMDQQSSEPVLLCGKLALDLSRLETALDYARIAMQRAPRQADVVLFLAQVYSALNRLPEALDVLERAIPEVEQAAEVLVERARLVLKLKGPQASLELLKELVEQLPEHLDALSLLAGTLVELGDLAAAEAVIHASLRIDPEQPAINLLMGKLQRQLGQLDQAIHYLSEAVRQAPDTVLGFLELAKTHLQRREDVQALNIYQQAIKVAPEDARAYYQAALILRETKDYLGAENMLRTAAKLAPDDLSIRRQLGAIIALNLVHNTQEATTNP